MEFYVSRNYDTSPQNRRVLKGYAMLKNRVGSLLSVIAVSALSAFGGFDGLREQVKILENYEDVALSVIFDTVKKDLLSEDALVQDAGCIILLKTIDRLKEGDAKALFIVTQLSIDKKVVGAAEDIIDSRLLGWYNGEKPEETDDDIKVYASLFYILAKSDDTYARGILVKSFLCLYDRKDIFKGIPMSEELVRISLKRQKIIEDKLCCLYPGKDWVIEMLDKDSKSGMLDILENFLMVHPDFSEKMKNEIKAFTSDCLKYGDSKNGYLIRIKAAKITGMLIKNGEKDLARKLEDLSKNDPCYKHTYDKKTGYSLTELKYPVREICSKIISMHQLP